MFVNGNCVFYAKQVACRFKKVQVFVGIKRTQSFLKKVFFHTKEVVKHNSHVETRHLENIGHHCYSQHAIFWPLSGKEVACWEQRQRCPNCWFKGVVFLLNSVI